MFLDFILIDRETRELKKMNCIMRSVIEVKGKSDKEILAICKRLRSMLLDLNIKKAKSYLDAYLTILDNYENIYSNTGRKHDRNNDTKA